MHDKNLLFFFLLFSELFGFKAGGICVIVENSLLCLMMCRMTPGEMLTAPTGPFKFFEILLLLLLLTGPSDWFLLLCDC